MNVKQRVGRLPGAVRAVLVGGLVVSLIGSGTAVAFAGTPSEVGGTPAMSTFALAAVGPDGEPLDPADLPAPGDGPQYLTATMDENGNVTTSEGTEPPPVPEGAAGPMSSSAGLIGEGEGAGAQAGVMKLVEVGAGETITESFTAPDMAPKLDEVKSAPDGLEITSAVTGAGSAEDPQVVTLTITNTTDAAISGPIGVSFVQ
jgi:hypothetical protein